MSLSRAENSLLAAWWFTIDRTLLALVLALVGLGLVVSLAASPAVAEAKHLPRYYFVERHAVFAALSVTTACLLPESPAHGLAAIPSGRTKLMLVEHPTGASPVSITLDEPGGQIAVREAALVSTARKLFAGHVYVAG